MIIAISIFGYLFGLFTTMYIVRRKNMMGWKITEYKWGTNDYALAKQQWDKTDIIVYSIFWAITVVITIIYQIIKNILILVCGGTNSLFTKLDNILDAPRVKKIKIDKRIIGYSLDEENISFPSLIRAIEAAPEKPIFVHYIDNSHSIVEEDRIKLLKEA